jgi:hypothetical protein
VKRPNYKLFRLISTVAACLAADVMAFITIMAERTPSVLAFWLALPGLVCHFLITACLRNSHTGDVAGYTSAILVNASLAAAPFFLLLGARSFLPQGRRLTK